MSIDDCKWFHLGNSAQRTNDARDRCIGLIEGSLKNGKHFLQILKQFLLDSLNTFNMGNTTSKKQKPQQLEQRSQVKSFPSLQTEPIYLATANTYSIGKKFIKKHQLYQAFQKHETTYSNTRMLHQKSNSKAIKDKLHSSKF